MTNILITGAISFIGKVICERMLTRGWRVRGTVRNSEDLKKLPTEVDAVQVESIGPDTDCSKALNGVDAVVHLTARVHVMNDTASDPLAAFRWVNVKGTERLARMAADANVSRFFL